MPARSLVIISGISGSGKSTALCALEDLGYFCVDNLPTPLIHSFADFLLGGAGGPGEAAGQRPPERGGSTGAHARDFALLVDCRDADSVRQVLEVVDKLRGAGVKVLLLYFDCADEVALRRFQETRRPHPLLVFDESGRTLAEALWREREILSDFRGAATQIVDTTSFSPHQLRQRMLDTLGERLHMEISLVSFGFKFGPPADADCLVDVRFLPNPYFCPEELRERTGLDAAVAAYALRNPMGESFLEKYSALLELLLPLYQQEGKIYFTAAVGCTGGKHRSVAVVQELEKRLGEKGYRAGVRHRDMERR